MFCAVCTKPFLYFLRYHSCFFLVTLIRHTSSSPAIVSCPISDRCAGSRSAIQRDASLGGSCATRVCLCAVNSSCTLRHSLSGSARTGGSIRCQCALRCPGHSLIWRAALSRTFADIYGALRCRGHSPIWRAMLPRTLLLFGGASMGVQVFIDTGEFCVL